MALGGTAVALYAFARALPAQAIPMTDAAGNGYLNGPLLASDRSWTLSPDETFCAGTTFCVEMLVVSCDEHIIISVFDLTLHNHLSQGFVTSTRTQVPSIGLQHK